MTVPETPDEPDLRQIEQFVYREARYADEHDYDGWEALWTDDALYWVPAGGDLGEPGGRSVEEHRFRRRLDLHRQARLPGEDGADVGDQRVGAEVERLLSPFDRALEHAPIH